MWFHLQIDEKPRAQRLSFIKGQIKFAQEPTTTSPFERHICLFLILVSPHPCCHLQFFQLTQKSLSYLNILSPATDILIHY